MLVIELRLKNKKVSELIIFPSLSIFETAWLILAFLEASMILEGDKFVKMDKRVVAVVL